MVTKPAKLILILFTCCTSLLPIYAQALKTSGAIPTTIVKESRAAIQRGVNFLTDRQQENGSWLESPAITGLACIALHQYNSKELETIRKNAIQKGRLFILKHVNKNGSISVDKQYVNYTTAVCLSALAIINNPSDRKVMRNARRFLIGSQLNENNQQNPTSKDNPYYGGIGYGSGGPKRPDLSNTQWALEALYLTDYLDNEQNGGTPQDRKKSEIAWKDAIQFLKAVQNVPESADNSWIVNTKKDPKDDGGFIYKPGDSKVNSKLAKQGQQVEGLRSYGSMTYAGLKSMIYAKLKKDDYRVKAAVDWASKHYTLKENPVMGPEGLYYYLHTFAKAHAAYGDDIIKTSDGKTHNWRQELLLQFLQTQRSKGEWYNDNGRWQESVPELVTAYALIAMEIALGPQNKD